MLCLPPAVRVKTGTRIFVKYELVRDLLVQGMDCMRINCAHGSSNADLIVQQMSGRRMFYRPLV